MPHLDTVYRVALRMTGEPARADDLVQDTMLKAYRFWHRYESGTNVRAWLLTILRNTFVSARRRPYRRARTVELSDVVEKVELDERLQINPEDESMRQIFGQRVSQAITTLPDEFRETLVMIDLAGLKYAEVAQVVGVPVGTVKSRLFRARRILQGLLYEYAVDMGYIQPRGEPGRSGEADERRSRKPELACCG